MKLKKYIYNVCISKKKVENLCITKKKSKIWPIVYIFIF